MAALADALPLEVQAPRLHGHPLLRGRRQAALRRAVADARRFAVREIRPRALEIDRQMEADPNAFPWDLATAGGRIGLLNLCLPRVAGGDADQFCLRTSLVIEEIAAGCGGMATLFGAHALGITPLLVSGAGHWDGLMRDLARSAVSGERPLIMACAITEPMSGTDVEHHVHVRTAKLNSRAERVSGGYRLSGVKHFISNGSVADWITVILAEDPKRPYETMRAFLVDPKSPGFAVTKVEHKMGQRASPAAELTLTDVFVPDDRAIGRPGDGIAATMAVLAGSRPVVGAIGTGIARGAYERLLRWLQTDPAADGLLGHQQVQLGLARMEELIHGARQTYLDAATEFDTVSMGRVFGLPMVQALARLPRVARTNPIARRQIQSDWSTHVLMRLVERHVGDAALTRSLGLSSLAKAQGADAAMEVSGLALEIAGTGCGPLRPELQKCWRDAKLCQIYEGTNQLNRLEVYGGLVAREAMGVLPTAADAPGQEGTHR